MKGDWIGVLMYIVITIIIFIVIWLCIKDTPLVDPSHIIDWFPPDGVKEY